MFSGEAAMPMTVKHFFDANTSTFSYVVSDNETSHCAIIDPVLDLDYASGTLSTDSADTLIAYIQDSGLAVVASWRPIFMPIISQERRTFRQSSVEK